MIFAVFISVFFAGVAVIAALESRSAARRALAAADAAAAVTRRPLDNLPLSGMPNPGVYIYQEPSAMPQPPAQSSVSFHLPTATITHSAPPGRG